MAKSQPPGPVIMTFLGSWVFAKGHDEAIRLGPDPVPLVYLRRRASGRRHRGEMLWRRREEMTADEPEHRSPAESREEAWPRCRLRALGGLPTRGFGGLASGTVREDTSAALRHQVWGARNKYISKASHCSRKQRVSVPLRLGCAEGLRPQEDRLLADGHC